MEEWKYIEGLPNGRRYQVSSEGKVSNFLTGRILTPSITNAGYQRVIMGKPYNGKTSGYQIHILVARAFIGDSLGRDVNHKDGNKLNNRVENLEYCSRSENLKHAYSVLGKKVHNIKLTKEIAEKIREEIREGLVTQRAIAKKYDVSPMLISRIKHSVQKEYAN